MTPAGFIPEELLRFLDAYVDSIEQLELLRIVAESPAREWNIQELATRAQALPTAIAALEQRGLLKTEAIGSEVRCTSASMTPEMENMLNRLLRLYKARPVTLIKIVSVRGSERRKAFADAFRFRRET